MCRFGVKFKEVENYRFSSGLTIVMDVDGRAKRNTMYWRIRKNAQNTKSDGRALKEPFFVLLLFAFNVYFVL